MKPVSSFTAITSEGGLLPADFLVELLAPKTAIEGLTPISYNLAEGERISEQVNRSWNRLKGRWADFKKAISDKPDGAPTTTETRDRWLQPFFQELGFGQRLPLAQPIEVDGRTYPVSHGWSHVPIHLVGSHLDLDTRTPGAVGAAKASPHSLVQQVLNASEQHLWGIVSNGFIFRLIRDNIALTRLSYVEWDLKAIFDGDLYSEFFVLWLVTHQSRFEGEQADHCWLEKWKKVAANKGLRALENLRPGVARAIEALGAGLVSHPANQSLCAKLSRGEPTPQEFYRQVLRVIYRMLFLFVAEDRGLLHSPLPKEDAPREKLENAQRTRTRYREFYAITRLRGLTLHRAGTPHPDLWQVFQFVTQKLGSDTGCPELDLPALGSFLWDAARSTPDLTEALVSNRHFLTAIHALGFVQEGSVRRAIDYKNLGSEELGSVYEGLLELHPLINADSGAFELNIASGNERKTSGSYYTPDSLVQCLLDSALEPVMAEIARGKLGQSAADALLNLKICDPAVGSGHFLIAAAHRLAKRVAAARSGEEEPSPKDTRSALRDVIGRCLYGVDLNPMAAELCRVSLWLEALEPGKPLSFLDHHIRVGNSLLGATPELILAGLPDDAFTAIEGDDKKACAALKKRNKAEREKGGGALFAQQDAETQAQLQQAAAALEELPDDRPEHIRAKELAFRRHEETPVYRYKKQLADTWCAAFVIGKYFPPLASDPRFSSTEPLGITQRHLNDLANSRSVPTELAAEMERQSGQYQFFHWHLAFPEVFAKGGFNCVLGNPPWDKIQPEEEKFFSTIRPDIANASSAKVRKALIEALPNDDPASHSAWQVYKRQIDSTCHFLRSSGALRFTGEGNLNSYRIFTELVAKVTAPSGRAGLVAQTGLATDESGKELFDHLLSSGRLCRFLDFENRGAFFEDVHQQFRFCLITFRGGGVTSTSNSAEFGWLMHSLDELRSPNRLVQLTAADLLLFNPTSRTCPVFISARDVEISRRIYRHGEHVMLDEERRFARIDFLGELFNMTRDSPLFQHAPPERSLPLYEAKFIHQFDHRYASTINREVTDLSEGLKSDANCIVVPRHFVDARVVRERTAKRDIKSNWLFGFRSIASPTNERTAIATVVPFSAVGNSINLILGLTAEQTLFLMANTNSFAFDFCARQKISGSNVNIWIFKQLPAVPLKRYEDRTPWLQNKQTLREWIVPRALELTYTAWDVKPFAQDYGWPGPPFRWDDARRFLLRCELDAAFFHFYLSSTKVGDWHPADGETAEDLARLRQSFPTPRDAVAYIMETFPIVRRRDEEKYDGDYRTKRVILEIYDAMQESIRTGQPYQTRLDPPPADPRCCHPPRAT